MPPLPVTLVTGFFGGGKTSLLHHLVSEIPGGPLALGFESGGPGSDFDLQALRGLLGMMGRKLDAITALPRGDDAALLHQLIAWAQEGRFAQALIELSASSGPVPVARGFGLTPHTLDLTGGAARLERIVCVVDALEWARSLTPPRAPGPDWLLDFRHGQIEAATHLVLNKCDLVDDRERLAVADLLRAINPDATLIETEYGALPPEFWRAPATLQQLALATERRTRPPSPSAAPEEESLPTAELTAASYRAFRPLHPQRFWAWFEAEHPGLVRVKGLIWLASRHLLVGGVSRTRWQNSCGGAGIWWDALPREEWPGETEKLLALQEVWREPYGDRRQDLVCMGEPAALPAILRQLEACLLTDSEFALGPAAWAQGPDPFPAWDV